MSDLVTPSQLKAWPGIDPELDAGLAESLLDQVEETFERDAGRWARPFQAKQLARLERRDGTGTADLWLEYRIAALTWVKLGYDSANPDETLVVNDQTKLAWSINSRRLTRVDGGRFGRYGQPGYVHITYDAAADLPADAALAITRAAAGYLARTGNENLKSERLGAWGADYGSIAAEDPEWQAAVSRHRRVLV